METQRRRKRRSRAVLYSSGRLRGSACSLAWTSMLCSCGRLALWQLARQTQEPRCQMHRALTCSVSCVRVSACCAGP